MGRNYAHLHFTIRSQTKTAICNNNNKPNLPNDVKFKRFNAMSEAETEPKQTEKCNAHFIEEKTRRSKKTHGKQ